MFSRLTLTVFLSATMTLPCLAANSGNETSHVRPECDNILARLGVTKSGQIKKRISQKDVSNLISGIMKESRAKGTTSTPLLYGFGESEHWSLKPLIDTAEVQAMVYGQTEFGSNQITSIQPFNEVSSTDSGNYVVLRPNYLNHSNSLFVVRANGNTADSAKIVHRIKTDDQNAIFSSAKFLSAASNGSTLRVVQDSYRGHDVRFYRFDGNSHHELKSLNDILKFKKITRIIPLSESYYYLIVPHEGDENRAVEVIVQYTPDMSDARVLLYHPFSLDGPVQLLVALGNPQVDRVLLIKERTDTKSPRLELHLDLQDTQNIYYFNIDIMGYDYRVSASQSKSYRVPVINDKTTEVFVEPKYDGVETVFTHVDKLGKVLGKWVVQGPLYDTRVFKTNSGFVLTHHTIDHRNLWTQLLPDGKVDTVTAPSNEFKLMDIRGDVIVGVPNLTAGPVSAQLQLIPLNRIKKN